MKNQLKRFEEWSMNENEWDAEIMADMVQTERTDAIKDYQKWRETVDRLEDELEIAQDNLESAIDKLDMMGVVEYE